jgi:histone deacetylase complex regulatory component SIN3
MKITSKEFIIIERFTPVKVIDIYANGKFLTRYKTSNTTETLKTIKEKQRHERKATKDNRKLAIQDNFNNIYHYTYYHHFKSIAEEYRELKRLKEYIENENKNVIQMQDESGIKEYKKEYKIIYAGIAV